MPTTPPTSPRRRANRPFPKPRLAAAGLGVIAIAAAGLGAGLLPAAPPAAAAEKKQGVFFPEVATLKNGMQVVVITNRRAPVVRHMVWYKVGAADEAPGKSGIAHFLEHLMFKRTKKLKAGEFDRIIHRNGGQQNAFTSQDYTGYYQTVAKSRLGLVMKLEADRMVNLTMNKAEVDAERKVIMEERRSRTDNRPSSLLWEAARAALFRNHPYGIPIIGWMHEMARLSREDALSFYRLHYRPNNAILIVAGDVSMKEVLPLAKKYYGVIPAGAVPPRVRPAEPPSRAARRVTLRDRRVARPSWGRLYLAPSYSRGAKQHAYALEVLSRILGNSNTARWYENLVVQQKLATRVGTWYDGTSLDRSEFGLNANPRPGVSVAKLEAAIDAQIALVLEKGVTKEEVERAKRAMLDSAIFARDSIYTGAMVFGQALTSGQTVRDVEEYPQRIKAVTVAQVNAAARYIFQARRSVTAILLPEARARRAQAAPAKTSPAKTAPTKTAPAKTAPAKTK